MSPAPTIVVLRSRCLSELKGVGGGEKGDGETGKATRATRTFRRGRRRTREVSCEPRGERDSVVRQKSRWKTFESER